MNAKYVYSQPIYTIEKKVCFNANGDVLGFINGSNKKGVFLPRYTVCSILDNDTRTLSFGIARCSGKDKFKKEIGRQLSLKRAMENPIYKVVVPEDQKISDVTVEVAAKLIEQCETNREFNF